MLLLYDVDRTFRFNKPKENIPYSVYKSGITSRDGVAIIGSVGMSDRSVRNARKGLIEKGLEKVIIGGGRGYSKVTVIFSALKKLITKEMKKMLKTPKKQRNLGGEESATLGGNIAVANKVTEVEETESLKTINKAKAPLRSDSLSTGEKAKQKHEKKHKKIVSKIILPTIKNVTMVWADAIHAYKEYHPGVRVINPTDKELKMFVRRTKQIFKDNSWKDVLYDAVTGWDSLVPHFTWLDSASFGGGAPSVPSMQFLRSFYPQIIEAQQDQLKIEARNKAVQERRVMTGAADNKVMKGMKSKIKDLEKKLRKEKELAENIKIKNNNLSSTILRMNDSKKEYYDALPVLSDSELMSMELPDYKDLPQNRVN